MDNRLEGKTLGIIHAAAITIDAMKPFIARYIPEVSIMNLADDTIQRDNIAAGAGNIPKRNYYKFAQYAHNLEEAGVDAILLACSTFNYAAELARPMINLPIEQIDRPMMERAVQDGGADRPPGHARDHRSVLRTPPGPSWPPGPASGSSARPCWPRPRLKRI